MRPNEYGKYMDLKQIKICGITSVNHFQFWPPEAIMNKFANLQFELWTVMRVASESKA